MDALPGLDERASGGEDGLKFLCAGRWSSEVGAAAAEVGGADLAVAFPVDFWVGEQGGAHVGDGDGEVAHLGEGSEELADVFVCWEISWERVVEAVVGAGGVFEDLKGGAGGFDQGEHAGDGDGAEIGEVEGFEIGGGTGDEV